MKFKLFILTLLVAVMVIPINTQERAKKTAPPDFKKDTAAATKAFDAGEYSKCLHHLSRATMAVTEIRRAKVLAAFPVLPADFKVKDDKGYKEAMNNPFASKMAGFMNLSNMIDRTYTQTGGKRLEVTLHLDSAAAKAFGTMLGMMREKNSEVINYAGGIQALLKKVGNGFTLQLVLLGQHFLEAKGVRFSDEELLKVFSQAVIDALIAALSK